MIVGSGLLARAFAPHPVSMGNVCLYAAGVSNSSCSDELEFERDETRLKEALDRTDPNMQVIYFSTCSVADPWASNQRYTSHKTRLERLVCARSRFLILRLPQLAGKTPNPHTLLNYLYNRIVRSERFDLWRNASRNIIDVDDVVKITGDLVATERVESEIINIANIRNYSLPEIISQLEITTGRRAIYNSLDKGGDYPIDTARIMNSIRRCGIEFDDGYLLRTLGKYYA